MAEKTADFAGAKWGSRLDRGFQPVKCFAREFPSGDSCNAADIKPETHCLGLEPAAPVGGVIHIDEKHRDLFVRAHALDPPDLDSLDYCHAAEIVGKGAETGPKPAEWP